MQGGVGEELVQLKVRTGRTRGRLLVGKRACPLAERHEFEDEHIFDGQYFAQCRRRLLGRPVKLRDVHLEFRNI